MAEDVGPFDLELRAGAMGKRGETPVAGQALCGWMAADTFVFRARADGVRTEGVRADAVIALSRFRIEPISLDDRMLSFEDLARAAMLCIDTAQGALLTLADGTTLVFEGIDAATLWADLGRVSVG